MASRRRTKGEKLASTLSVWRRLVVFLQPFRLRLLLTLGLTIAAVLAELAKPWPLKVVIDNVLGDQKNWDLLPTWLQGPENTNLLLSVACGAILLCSLIAGGAGYLRDLWLAETGQRVVNKVRRQALERILVQSLAWQERRRRGDLLLRLVGDAGSLRMLLVDGLFSLTKEALILVGTLAVMAWLDWQLTLIAIAVLPLIGVLTALMGVKLRRAARKQRQKEGELATSVHETLSAIPVIQAYGLEREATLAFARQNRKSGKAGLQATRIEGRLGIGSDLAMAVGTAFVLLFGVWRVQANAITTGDLLVIVTYVRAFYRPIRKGLSRSAAMVKAAAAGERILELLDAKSDLKQPAVPRTMPTVRGEVELHAVSFKHGDGRHVLKDTNLKLAAGEHVALLGDNGAGKSTLATLLPRLRDPQSGRVTLDGVDLRELDLTLVRSTIAMVFQETVLFDGTLLENIQLGKPDAPRAAVLAAAEAAGVIAFANRWPEGLERQVGERGTELSGGERQRVALARAFLRGASVIVLDEPSTGLDAAAEARLGDEILKSLRGRTVLLITHNPRLLAGVNRVVRLVEGKIVDAGKDGFSAPFTKLAGGQG